MMGVKVREKRLVQGRMRAQTKSGPGSATNTVIPGPNHYQGVAMGKRTCSIDECDRNAKARGWCQKHWSRWRKSGSPHRPARFGVMGMTLKQAVDTFVKSDGDCIVWTGTVRPDGYGLLRLKGVTWRTHRAAWTVKFGAIPDGMVVDHICWNRACLNTDHLRLATHGQNVSNRSPESVTSATGVRNVYLSKGGRFTVQVKLGGKARSFGTYDTIEEASKVAARAREGLFGGYSGASHSTSPRDVDLERSKKIWNVSCGLCGREMRRESIKRHMQEIHDPMRPHPSVSLRSNTGYKNVSREKNGSFRVSVVREGRRRQLKVWSLDEAVRLAGLMETRADR